MAMYVLPSIRPVLVGSMVLLVSAACQRGERSDVDTNTPTEPQATTEPQRAPTPAPSEYSSALEQQRREEERAERIHVTGKDIDQGALERQREEQERAERIHVTGRDDELQLGGGGSGGSGGGSGGMGGTSVH